MPMEPRDQSSIDALHQKITDLLAELDLFRQDPTLAAWVPGLDAMLQQLKDLLDMAPSEQAEIQLLQWAGVFATYHQGLKDLSPELSKSLADLPIAIEKGVDAGWWRVVAELPSWAEDLDPAEGHSLDGFAQFLMLMEALEDTEIPLRDYEIKAALEQRRKTLRTWAQRWIREGVSLEGIEAGKVVSDIPDEATADRWQALEDFVVEWSIRAGDKTPGDAFETTIMLRHQALNDIKNLGVIPPGQGYRDTFEVIERLLVDDLDAVARITWVDTRDLPEPSFANGESAAQIADRELNLRFFSELPLFIEYIEKLWSALESGESPAEGIYEASIICKNLLCRSGNRALDVLDRKLTRMVQLVSERGEVPEHERRLMHLDETFAQGLAIYKHLDAAAFVSSLCQIEGLDEPKSPRPPDDLEASADQPPSSISSPRDAERVLSYAIHQAEIHLKKQPLDESLAELHRLLLKTGQSVHHGRSLSEEQNARIADKLKTAASCQPDNLTHLLINFGNYFRGKKIASRSVFASVLDKTIKDARSKTKTFSYADARPVWASVERQLRAVKRWTAGKRMPSAEEREMTHNILEESAAVLEDNKTEKDFVRCVRELDAAVQQWETLEADKVLTLDIEPISSDEQLLEDLQEMEEICQELAYRPAFADPTSEQEPVIEIIHKLSKMKSLSRKGRKSTTQERAHVMSIIADADKVSSELCPTIPDFREVFIADIQRLTDGFEQLMKTPDFAAAEIRPLEKKGTSGHVLSPKNWVLMGFVQSEGKTPGLYRCGYEGVDAGREQIDGMEIALAKFSPNREKLACMVPSEDKRITDLSWDPYGYMLAFRFPDESIVGWARAGEVAMPLETGEARGSSYIWTSKGDGLVVSDIEAGKLCRVDIATGESLILTDLDDDGDPEQPPRMAVPQYGGSLAFTSRSSMNSTVSLQVLTYRRRRPVIRLLKEVPDVTATLLPFWLEQDQLGVMIISPKEKTTSIISICLREMVEEILYTSETLEPARTPCPSPSLRYLAFFRTSGLSLLDIDKGVILQLLPAGRVDGELRFGNDIIFVEGGDAAYGVELKDFKDERVPLPSL